MIKKCILISKYLRVSLCQSPPESYFSSPIISLLLTAIITTCCSMLILLNCLIIKQYLIDCEFRIICCYVFLSFLVLLPPFVVNVVTVVINGYMCFLSIFFVISFHHFVVRSHYCYYFSIIIYIVHLFVFFFSQSLLQTLFDPISCKHMALNGHFQISQTWCDRRNKWLKGSWLGWKVLFCISHFLDGLYGYKFSAMTMLQTGNCWAQNELPVVPIWTTNGH